MLRVGRTFGNPAFEKPDLLGVERVLVFGWWHDDVRIVRANASQEFAFERLARYDHIDARTLCESRLALVETKLRLAGTLVRTVTLKTVFGKDRANLALKIDGLSRFNYAGWRQRERIRQGERSGDSKEA